MATPPSGGVDKEKKLCTHGPKDRRNVGGTQARQGIWTTTRRRITWIGVGLPMEVSPSVAVMGPFEIVKLCLAPLPRGRKEAHGLPDTLQRASGNSASPIGPSVQDADELT